MLLVLLLVLLLLLLLGTCNNTADNEMQTVRYSWRLQKGSV